MPKQNKRVASKQAALSRRKRRKAGARPPVAIPEAHAPAVAPPDLEDGTGGPAEEDGAGAVTAPAFTPAPAPPAAAAAPRFQVPSRVAQGLAAAPAHRGLPQSPYLRSDLKTIGKVSGAILVVLIILGFIA